MSHDRNSKKASKKRTIDVAAEPTLDSLAQDIQSRFLEVQDHIQVFQKAYDALLGGIVESQERAQMRAREVNRSLGFFTPVVSDVDRYIKLLELLYQQSFFIHRSFQLKDVFSELLKDINLVGDMRDLFSFWHDALTSYITFVRSQVLSLVKGYDQNQDEAFKNEIKRKLDENPKVLAWLQPFLDSELKQDPLLVSVCTLVQERAKKQKLADIDIVKGAFDAEIIQKLPVLKKIIGAQFEKMESFLKTGETVERKTYLDKVQYYADFCIKILKGFSATIQYLRQLIQSTEGYINKIRGIDPEGDIKDLVAISIKLEQWEKKLSTELDSIFRPMQVISKEYFQYKDELPHNLRVFMRPWLNPKHPYPLAASVYAYENPNDFQEATQPPQPPRSAEEQAEEEKFYRQVNRRA